MHGVWVWIFYWLQIQTSCIHSCEECLISNKLSNTLQTVTYTDTQMWIFCFSYNFGWIEQRHWTSIFKWFSQSIKESFRNMVLCNFQIVNDHRRMNHRSKYMTWIVIPSNQSTDRLKLKWSNKRTIMYGTIYNQTTAGSPISSSNHKIDGWFISIRFSIWYFFLACFNVCWAAILWHFGDQSVHLWII